MTNIYQVRGRDGSIFDPVFRTKAEAKALRYHPSMPNPKETHTVELIIADGISEAQRLDYLASHAALYGDGKKVIGMMIKFPADGSCADLRAAVDDAIRKERA